MSKNGLSVSKGMVVVENTCSNKTLRKIQKIQMVPSLQ